MADYSLEYSGQRGALRAALLHAGETVDTTVVADIKDAEKWAAKAARNHKAENTPEPTSYHSITGGKHFTL